MRKKNEILEEINLKEKELDLYDFKVLDVSIWRLVRFSIRVKKIKEYCVYSNRTTKVKVSLYELLTSYLKSLFQYFGLIFKNLNTPYLVLAFPRLIKQKNSYFDKFTDPLIAQSNLKNNTLVLQRNLSGKQFKPRENVGVVHGTSDFIEYTSKIIGLFLSPIFYLLFFTKINKLIKRASVYFSISRKYILIISYKTAEFCTGYFLVNLLLKNLKIKKIFLVNRAIFMPFIAVAKKMNIQVYELQHGITHSETELYTGEYQKEIDPDIFLNFGSKWIGNQFSVPLEKQINIGWAYNSWLLTKVNVKIKNNSVLVVSSPAISNQIIKTTLQLANKYKDYFFNIRLHPQEALSKRQKEILINIPNISVVDNQNVDSLISVLEHQFVIGENSSVIYEALNFDKRVGKIMFNGLDSKNKLDDDINGIEYIYSIEDFALFLSNRSNKIKDSSGIYDTFDVEKFNKLLK